MARHYVKNRMPETPRELAQLFRDPQAAAELMGGTAEAWRDFEREFANASPLVAKMAEEQAQMQLAGTLRAGGTGAVRGGEAWRGGSVRNRIYSRHAPGTAVEGVAGSMGWAEFVQAADPRNYEGEEFRGKIRNAMSERVPSGGGLLVPETLRSDILMAALEKTVVRSRAHIVPMDSLRIPYPTIDDTSHTASVLGGLVGFWTEEAAQLTPSQPSFGRVVLEAKKLTIYTDIPNELMADAPGLEGFIGRVFPDALAFYEDLAFLTGSGVGQPQGVLNAPAAVSVTRTAANQVQFADIAGMYARMLPVALPGAVWVCSPAVIPQLLQMTVAGVAGAATAVAVAPPVWLMEMNAAGDVPTTLLGHELIVTEKVPTLGTKGDLMFCNFGYYLLGDRQEMRLNVSEDYKFQNDLQSWRLIERCDGRAWIQSPITPENGGATLSPFVLLQ